MRAAPDASQHIVGHRGLRRRRCITELAEHAQRATQRIEDLCTPPAARDVPVDACPGSNVELTVEVRAHPAARAPTATVGDHGPWRHDQLDAVSAENDSASSADLVSRLQRGDEQALAELVRAHERRIASLIGRLLDDPQDVMEATQDTFVRVWRNIGSFRGEAALATWMHRIAMNEALMRARRKRLVQTTFDRLTGTPAEHGADLAAQASARAARVRAVRVALASLPIDQRAAVALRDLEGYSSTDAAAILDIAEPALKTRLHRGRMRLRSLLADLAEDAE